MGAGWVVLKGVGWCGVCEWVGWRWCRGDVEVVRGWCGGVVKLVWGGVGAVRGLCGCGAGVVWVGLGVTVTVIDVNWVTHALCSDLMVRGDVGVGLTQEGVGHALPSSNMYDDILLSAKPSIFPTLYPLLPTLTIL